MKVAIVAEQLRRRVPGGIGTYVTGLVRALPSTVDVSLVASRAGSPDPLDAFGRRTILSPFPGPLATRLWDRDLLADPHGFDLSHATSFAVPRKRTRRRTTFVHDLAWRTHPEAYPPRGREWHERGLHRAMRASDLLLTPSRETADALADAGAGRVEVIEHGADHLPPADHDAARAILRGLGVEPPFLLAVGTLEPRKNLRRVLDAYRLARSSLPEPWPLVVIGARGWGDEVAPPPGVHLPGFVPDEVLAALYATARCLVYAPLQEGFGLPPVEAMHAALPVVASPMPSIAGAALEVDPLDVESIAAGIATAAGDDRERSRLVTGGLIRTRDLTWERSAARHVELWQELCA